MCVFGKDDGLDMVELLTATLFYPYRFRTVPYLFKDKVELWRGSKKNLPNR